MHYIYIMYCNVLFEVAFEMSNLIGCQGTAQSFKRARGLCSSKNMYESGLFL